MFIYILLLSCTLLYDSLNVVRNVERKFSNRRDLRSFLSLLSGEAFNQLVLTGEIDWIEGHSDVTVGVFRVLVPQSKSD